MRKVFGICLLTFFAFSSKAQESPLPEDLRAHNLTQFNSSLLNPTFSHDWNRPHAASIWSRWQWQSIDGDPTTLFLSYTHKLNQASTLGGGFLQHNTGTFLNTGGVLTYTHTIEFAPNIKLLVGANIQAFQQELADNRFAPDEDINLPQFRETDDFLLQFTPGIRLLVNDFSLALALENALDFNLTESERESFGRVFTGVLSNDFPVALSDGLGNSFIRPMLYVRTIPNADTQVGLNALLSTSKFWVQGGYNSFYGPSAGLGITVLKHFSVGGLMEFPTGSDLDGEDATIELLFSYHFGRQNNRKQIVDVDEDDAKPTEDILEEEKEAQQREEARKQAEAQAREEARKQEEAKKKAEAQAREEARKQEESRKQAEAQAREEAKEQEEAERLQRERDSISAALAEAQRKKVQDSLARIRKMEEEALREQKRLDSIASLQQEEVEVEAGEKYEEVTTADGLEPGFYLIANVFGTKKYFEAFMKKLKSEGLNPKSFYRKLNGYNYVYLERFNTIEEARKARDSKYFGKYPDKTWVFRVRR